MKTLAEVRKDIANIENKYVPGQQPKKKAEKKADQDLVAFYRNALLYLETSPTEDFIKKQMIDTLAKINRRLEMWKAPEDERILQKEINRRRREHEKEWGVPELRQKYRMLQYLLNESLIEQVEAEK